MSEPTLCSIYRLRVVLNGVSPLVWRRLLVSSETNLTDLHEILQLAFGWSGFYLYEFRIHGRTFGEERSVCPRCPASTKHLVRCARYSLRPSISSRRRMLWYLVDKIYEVSWL